MKDFIENIKEPQKIGAYNTFMSSFMGAQILFRSRKNFFIMLMISASIILSIAIPLLAFVTIPAFLSGALFIAKKTLYAEEYSFMQVLRTQTFKLAAKVRAFAPLVVIPLAIVIAGVTNFYYSIAPDHTIAASALYLLLVAIFLAMLWGVVIMVAMAYSQCDGIKLISVIVESIEALIKNFFLIFMLFVHWFLASVFLFFLINISNVIVTATFASNDVLYALMFYLSLFVILTLFVSWYLCQISSLAIYILTKEESDTIED